METNKRTRKKETRLDKVLWHPNATTLINRVLSHIQYSIKTHQVILHLNSCKTKQLTMLYPNDTILSPIKSPRPQGQWSNMLAFPDPYSSACLLLAKLLSVPNNDNPLSSYDHQQLYESWRVFSLFVPSSIPLTWPRNWSPQIIVIEMMFSCKPIATL